MAQETITDEEKRTLWVGGIDSQVDEEMLYELMLNAGPIESIKIPKDKNTQRSKSFAFVLYQYEESLQYAVDLFCDTRLFGTPLKLQNRATGVGISTPFKGRNTNHKVNSSEEHYNHNYISPSSASRLPSQNRATGDEIESPYDDPRYRNYNSPDRAAPVPMQRPNSTPRLQTHQIRELDMQMQQDFQPWQHNGFNSPGHLLNLYMNMMSSPELLSSPLGGSSPSGIGFRGLGVNGSRSLQDVTYGNSNYQVYQNNGSLNGDSPVTVYSARHPRSHLSRDTEDRNRNNRSRTNDRSRSREFNRRR